MDDVLPPSFYDRPAELVARELLGAIIVSTVDGVGTAGRIVETEAYTGPDDDASHAAARIGRTARNDAMFGPPGIAYVYRIYGVHWCLNAVTGRELHPAAVLIRALEPLEGLEAMRARRQAATPRGGPRGGEGGAGAPRTVPDRDLARGPGRLCQALGITGALDRHSLGETPLRFLPGRAGREEEVLATPRVGITRAAELPLRFVLRGSPWLSR